MNRRLLIHPSDTMFFRDGNNFDKSNNNYIASKEVPYPSVFYGAIAAAFMREGMLENVLDSIVKLNNSQIINEALSQRLNINGIYLCKREKNKLKLYINAPLDLFSNGIKTKAGSYVDDKLFCPYSKMFKYESVAGTYISMYDFVHAYCRDDYDISIYNETEFIKSNYKVGVEINNNRVAEEGLLYSIEMKEFSDSDICYLVEYSLDNKEHFEYRGIVKLGGEGKLAYANSFNEPVYEIDEMKAYCTGKKLDGTIFSRIYSRIKETKKAKLIFTTPALFPDENDCKSNDESTIKKRIDKWLSLRFNAKSSCIVCGKPEYVSGYDMASKKQKKMQTALPAGSIIVMEFKDSNDVDKLWAESNNYVQRGFGCFVVAPVMEGKNE